MKEISELLPALDVLIRGLGKHFGESVEFVVHDYKKDSPARSWPSPMAMLQKERWATAARPLD